MQNVPLDLGQRILQAARQAVELHLELSRQTSTSGSKSYSTNVGGADRIRVTDDATAFATLTGVALAGRGAE